MPTQFGRSKAQDFNYIMDRIWKKLKGWKEKKLSFEGRGVLIRAVAQAIPVYVMSCFLLPKSLCDNIERAVCNFWWGGSETTRKIHWVAKDKLFKPKRDGGMGFRILRDFNLAMLAKQAWRFHTNPHSLLAKCYKAKYYTLTDILQATTGSSPSYAWRSIAQAIWIINKGSVWKIGNGQKVRVMEDNWLPFQNGYKILSTNTTTTNQLMVKDLFQSNQFDWNYPLLQDLFLPIDNTQIIQLPIIHHNKEDELMWMFEPTGNYTVKSGYLAIQLWKQKENQNPSTSTNNDKTWQTIWSLHTIPRHKTILWRILNSSLPVRTELNRRGVNCNLLCPRCNEKLETIDHLFMDCSKTKKVWFGSQLSIRIPNSTDRNFKDWLYEIITTIDKQSITQVAALTYNIWHARNQAVFEDQIIPEETIIHRAQSSIQAYHQATTSSQFQLTAPFVHNANKSQGDGVWVASSGTQKELQWPRLHGVVMVLTVLRQRKHMLFWQACILL